LKKYPNVATWGVNPLIDFVERGAARGRSPHPLFDTAWYVAAYPELQLKPAQALMHFLEKGGFEGRHPCPFFDSAWYLETYADVRDGGTNPLVHYIEHGNREGRSPHPSFGRHWHSIQNSNGTGSYAYPFGSQREGNTPETTLDFLTFTFGQEC